MAKKITMWTGYALNYSNNVRFYTNRLNKPESLDEEKMNRIENCWGE